MRRNPVCTLAPALLVAAASAASPRPAQAQWVVWDPTNFGQAVARYALQGSQYATQLLELREAINTVTNLGRRIAQADSLISHQKDAANGRIAALTSSFTALTSDPASLLKSAGVSWANSLSGTSPQLVDALVNMDGGSLVTYLQAELQAADNVSEAELRTLYPSNLARGTQLAEAWRTGRESGDRIRGGDFLAADAAGRVAALLDNAQQRLAGRRGQGQLSHTALQQAQVANQLTQAEIDLATAQLLVIQAQQDAIARQQAELVERQRLEQWVQRERDAQARTRTYLADEDAREAAYRDALRLRIN